MAEHCTRKPSIVVDLKKYRIRIHKNTLRSIGAPEYIYLLVNPEEHTLAILRSDRFNPRAHHIPADLLENNKAVELYSRSLVKNLHDICSGWQESQSYRLFGEIIPNEGIARFHMSDAVPVKGLEI